MPAPDKLSVIVMSAEFERVHYALVLASAAAAVDKPATVFFTHGALRALTRSFLPDGEAGWRRLPTAARDQSGESMDADWQSRGVAGFEELLMACHSFGVRFVACEMGLRAMRLETAALRTDVPIEVAGVVTFLGDASATGAIVTL